jgi:hypothetical protein
MAKNPFDDDDDKDDKVADRAAVDSLRQKVAEGRTEEREDPEIDVDEAREDLEERAADSATPEPERATRLERRRNRYREQQESRAAAERERDDAKREASQTREMLLNLQRQLMSQQQPQQAQQPKSDPLDDELAGAFREQDMLYREYNQRQASLSAAEHEEFARKVRDLQKKIVITGGRIALRDQGGGVDMRQIEAMMTAKRMREDHGDVISDENRRMYMDGVWRQLRASGRPDDWDTLNDAAEQTRKRFGLPSKSKHAPSEGYKRKLSGVSRGAGAGGSSEPRVVTMTKEFRQMADASYRHIKDPAERYKRWATGPGRKLLEKGQ